MAPASVNDHLYNSAVVISTSFVAFLTGFILGVYSIRGYFISPDLVEERRRNLNDPEESAESDIDDDLVLDHAPNWANGVDADMRDGLRSHPVRQAKPEKEGEDVREECKLVLVVRTDLGMTKGKIAAQCSHATLACYKALSRAASKSPLSKEAKTLRKWETLGQAKIAVQVKSEDEMMALMAEARALGITAQVIQDAGRTQIDPGSLTVLGVGPAPRSMVDRVTGHLKLL
ncbi:hypothetical protein TD95_005057 [Thielaviopsis punctulata]|uniref:peptidyl-tRNA hydrolase n=1 Tax=Thielaviopsis punctulata TaxID=72032 RepID=A0A0F4ZLV4_9PEZI|nr:hypothetical protein TD95_005057 [Thielaviopsis punctulata]